MGAVLTLLLRLIRLSLASDDVLTIFSPELLLGGYFGDLIPAPALHEVAAALRRAEAASPPEQLRALATACARLGELPDEVGARAIVACHDCDLLLALRSADEHAPLTLQIDRAALLACVQQLSLPAHDGAPPTLVVGGPAQPLIPNEFTISLPDRHLIELRTEISYGLGVAFPRVRVNLPVRRAGQDVAPARRTWVQRPQPEYDLDVFTYRERHVGRITTRVLATPYRIASQALSLSFEGSGLQLLSTEVCTAAGTTLIRLVRVVDLAPPGARAASPG